MSAINLDSLVSLCKRRGFIYQSSEIYGGLAAIYDYGPYGVELANNIKQLWWKDLVYQYDNIVGLDSAIFMHPKVWQASGHIANFSDPLVECCRFDMFRYCMLFFLNFVYDVGILSSLCVSCINYS